MKLSRALKGAKPSLCIRATAMTVSDIDTVPISFHLATELFLADNKLKTLGNIGQFPSLVRLSLENNSISDIESLEPLRALTKLKEIRLRGNPVCQVPLFECHLTNICESLQVINNKRIKNFKNKNTSDLNNTNDEQIESDFSSISNSHINRSELNHQSKNKNNKAKCEIDIIYSLFIAEFIKSIEKRPKFEKVDNQFRSFLRRRGSYESFAHKIRYANLNTSEDNYFAFLRNLCCKSISKDLISETTFEALSSRIISKYFVKLCHLTRDEINRLGIPLFIHQEKKNQPNQSNAIRKMSLKSIDENTYESKNEYKIESKNDSKIESINEFKIESKSDSKREHQKKIDEKEKDVKLNNNQFSLAKSDNTKSSTSETIPSYSKKLTKNNDMNLSKCLSHGCISMPPIESDFSSLSFTRDIVFSEPVVQPRQLSLVVERTFEFDSIELEPEPPLDDDELLEFLNTSSSSSSSSSRGLPPILRLLPEIDDPSSSEASESDISPKRSMKRRRTKLPQSFNQDFFM
ncbi:hypothetical protein TRFO_36301 [Tritrichomonas foetus]|uniref:Leucine Rich Repeat family protein n=1 Tax=Tritrichomonas foetus TaxID=1144522 RepID=A0A1J4JEE1_9EUKA|nr:hypothetical protein TRFO_36301 [Tritrichomonas foetus]|eukprot:OHS97480.1 hypothetical protein TRFO_36301 [Tritrichomonas foetus]